MSDNAHHSVATTCPTCKSTKALLAELENELLTRHSGGFPAKYGADGTYMLRDVVSRLRRALVSKSGR